MSDFSERLEEIRRRSEELKDKERQRRRRMLALIPAVLCAAICVIACLPGQSAQKIPKEPGDGMADMERPPEMQMENYSASIQSVVSIQITGKGVDKQIHDPAVIAKVCLLLDAVTEPTPSFSNAGIPTGGTGTVYGDDRGQQDTAGKTQSADHYTVVVLNANGVDCTYRLDKSVLTELTTGETDFLMEDDLAQLYALLDLPTE